MRLVLGLLALLVALATGPPSTGVAMACHHDTVVSVAELGHGLTANHVSAFLLNTNGDDAVNAMLNSANLDIMEDGRPSAGISNAVEPLQEATYAVLMVRPWDDGVLNYPMVLVPTRDRILGVDMSADDPRTWDVVLDCKVAA